MCWLLFLFVLSDWGSWSAWSRCASIGRGCEKSRHRYCMLNGTSRTEYDKCDTSAEYVERGACYPEECSPQLSKSYLLMNELYTYIKIMHCYNSTNALFTNYIIYVLLFTSVRLLFVCISLYFHCLSISLLIYCKVSTHN